MATRINDQWRLVFRWSDGQSQDVQILDYHKVTYDLDKAAAA